MYQIITKILLIVKSKETKTILFIKENEEVPRFSESLSSKLFLKKQQNQKEIILIKDWGNLKLKLEKNQKKTILLRQREKENLFLTNTKENI